MSSYKRGKGGRSDDTMDDDSDDKDTKRKSRNLSEKKRRDQFNLLVNELSSMVSSAGRKMDKSTVLKNTISLLRNYNEATARSRIHEIQEDWKPSFLTNEEFSHLILEGLHGFIIVFTAPGEILYVSESIISLLGHLPNNALNSNIYELALEEEQNDLYSSLVSLCDEDNGQISFSCHLKCGGCNDQNNWFELVHFVGYFRSISETQGTKDRVGLETRDKRVFIGTGRLQTPQLITDMPANDTKSEFTSRHSLEWKFLFLDHRAPPIIGYLPFELLGTSGYDYYHVDDLDGVVSCHEALMQKGEGTSCYYRFLTKGQQWIWLQSRFYITYHQWNSKPEFIVCSHRVVSYGDVFKHNRLDVRDPSVTESNSTAWNAKTSQRCTDSPCSVGTQRSTHSRTSEAQSYTEPTHYIPTLPMQPVASGNYQTPLSPVEFSTQHTILHADLQRKHAELQASIGQQQAELMMVSEQLLMARLGLLSGQTQQVAPTFSLTTPGAVSSTTLLPTVHGDLLTPLVAVSSSDLFQTPDSNSSNNLTELN